MRTALYLLRLFREEWFVLCVLPSVVVATVIFTPAIRRNMTLSDFGTLLSGIGTIALALIAVMGFNQWRVQKNHDVGASLLTALFEYKSKLHTYRRYDIHNVSTRGAERIKLFALGGELDKQIHIANAVWEDALKDANKELLAITTRYGTQSGYWEIYTGPEPKITEKEEYRVYKDVQQRLRMDAVREKCQEIATLTFLDSEDDNEFNRNAVQHRSPGSPRPRRTLGIVAGSYRYPNGVTHIGAHLVQPRWGRCVGGPCTEGGVRLRRTDPGLYCATASQ
jgi:hypothetical protein